MSKRSHSRVEAEKAEDMPTQSNQVPDNRLQEDQQVASTDSALATKTENVPFTTKKSSAKGSVLKQQTISDAITGSTSSPGMGINAAGRGVSGTMGGVLGASNSTPEAGKSRDKSRVGKKLDRLATKLNYTPSEQVLLAVDESKPLADAANEDQGYNGTYRNSFARSQKIAGAVPGDLMYQRSVDLILKDQLYFVEGQMLFQGEAESNQYNPSSTYVNVDGRGDYQRKDVVYHTGNYLHRAFHFGIDTHGKVRYFYADVSGLNPSSLDAEDCNAASAHRLIKANVAELDRITMDSKAGDEKADLWTPLARAIEQPTRASFYMSSVEAETGAYVFLAYSKATVNMSYQLNRAAKDGLDVVTPAIEQCCGWRASEDNSISLGNDMGNVLDNNYVFNQTAYRAGDPSIMIAAYDSPAKYHNKADLLLQPRGYRMHLQTADNNMNPLRVPAEFANVYAATEVFSTIDHDYDPLLPICMTDKANLILAHNLNETCAFFNEAGYKHIHVIIDYDTTSGYTADQRLLIEANMPAKLGYQTLYIQYKEEDMGEDAGNGLEWDSTNHVVKIKSHSPLGSVTGIGYDIIVVPTPVSGYTTLATLAADSITYNVYFNGPKVEDNKITAIHQYLCEDDRWVYHQGGEYAYMYDDLRNNYFVEVKHPLITGMIEYLNESIGAKFRSLLGREEFYLPLIFSSQFMTLAQLFICAATPWIARVRLNSMKDVLYYQDNTGSYPYSKLASFKDVPFKNYVNFSYSDYDSPLETKIMNPVQAIRWVMPEFLWKVQDDNADDEYNTYVLPWYFNENDLNADGTVNADAANMSMPSIRSGVRLGALDTFYGMSEKDIRLSLDRLTKYFLKHGDVDEYVAYKYGRTTDGQIVSVFDPSKDYDLLWFLACPRELGLVIDAPIGVLTVDPGDGKGVTTSLKSLTTAGVRSSFRIKVWTNVNTYLHPSILAATGVNISRAANYTQKWFELCANGDTSNTEVAGLVFGMADDTHVFSPFAALGTGAPAIIDVNLNSYQRSLNTRIQFLPFIISPFDSNATGTDKHDIYDFAYMFGLCGFRASDYRESVYNREKEVVNMGITFVNDPWIDASPILKGSAASTGLAITKGYELK